MKRRLKFVLVLFALLLVFAQPASAAELPQAVNTIETSATGVVTVDPDVVQLSLTIRTEEESAALSQENNANAVNKAIDVLIGEGLNKNDIKTTNYSTYSYTKTDNDKTVNAITVYSTISGLEVSFKELDKVGEMLDKLANISEVNVNSVNYSIEDPANYKKQVIASAIAEAKQNILYSAEALGVKLDKLNYLTINFNSNSGYQTFPRIPVALKDSSISQPQNPDKITISATAIMSYLIQQ
ncbi:MAG: SIMPL domain-containing protein [Bacillota bacterium]|nr:SIMPL domain-containing protein [Bacillota bacterium]